MKNGLGRREGKDRGEGIKTESDEETPRIRIQGRLRLEIRPPVQ
jgi:hypothetical protein